MWRQYPKGVGEAAKQLRKSMTQAERKLWSRLRSKQIDGFKFRRQAAFHIYIIDFMCSEAKLIIEVDGRSHLNKHDEDAVRDAYFHDEGYTVLRFNNEEVIEDIESVIQSIRDVLLT